MFYTYTLNGLVQFCPKTWDKFVQKKVEFLRATQEETNCVKKGGQIVLKFPGTIHNFKWDKLSNLDATICFSSVDNLFLHIWTVYNGTGVTDNPIINTFRNLTLDQFELYRI